MISAFNFGPNIVIDDRLFTTITRAQIRFPRSKSKRIRRKWAKQERNWRTTRTLTPGMYQVGPSPGLFGGMTAPYFVCDSTTYERLAREVLNDPR